MEYKTTHINLKSSNQKDTLFCRAVIPTGEIKGVVQISHGMCEYIDRYLPFMQFLAKHGFVACGHDHIGHGRTCPNPELLGFFGEENGYKFLVDDVHRVNSLLHEQFPQVPFFLFGHSMGSMIARLYLSKYSDSIQGAIICGTAGPIPASKLGANLCQKIIDQKGPMFRPAIIDQMVFGNYNSKYENPRTEKDWLSRDTQVVDDFMNDPLCMYLFTICGYKDLISLQYFSNTPEWYKTLKCDLPIYLISGDMDPVGNYGKSVTTVFEKIKKAGVTDLTFKLYPEARHELLNELNRDEVQADILTWITAHLPAASDSTADVDILCSSSPVAL